MKASMVSAVGLLLVTFAIWIGQAKAQHRGKSVGAPPPRGGARPVAGKVHTPAPKAQPQQKPKAGAAKPAQKKKEQKEPAKEKHAEKKKHTFRETTKEHAKKAEKKASSKAAADHESIALLQAAHHKLHEADHDYDGHRRRAAEHVGAALGHLGSSAQSPMRSGTGRTNLPQSVSDAIMREARASLEMIRNRLAAKSTASAGHREAHGAVDAAIREIGLALNVR
jgi:outer membrane biosynthesis protein TonB